MSFYNQVLYHGKVFQVIKYFLCGLQYILAFAHFSKMISALKTHGSFCRSQWWRGTSFVACVKSVHHYRHSSAIWHLVLMSISYVVSSVLGMLGGKRVAFRDHSYRIMILNQKGLQRSFFLAPHFTQKATEF